MPPNNHSTGVPFEDDTTPATGVIQSMKRGPDPNHKMELLTLHVWSLYGVWLLFFVAKWQTFLLFPAALVLSILGVSRALQDSVYYWARDHRLPHKHSETDTDPYNSERGCFFSHIGWLCCKKHPDVTTTGRIIDLSDLRNHKMVMLGMKYYLILMPIVCFLLPTVLLRSHVRQAAVRHDHWALPLERTLAMESIAPPAWL